LITVGFIAVDTFNASELRRPSTPDMDHLTIAAVADPTRWRLRHGRVGSIFDGRPTALG